MVVYTHEELPKRWTGQYGVRSLSAGDRKVCECGEPVLWFVEITVGMYGNVDQLLPLCEGCYEAFVELEWGG